MNAYIPDGYTARLIASNHIRQQITEQLSRNGISVEFGQMQDDGTVRVSLVADGNSFSVRDYFNNPTLDGTAWIDADSTQARVDYDFGDNAQPVAFLMQHEQAAE
jgi:hypothetical protein